MKPIKNIKPSEGKPMKLITINPLVYINPLLNLNKFKMENRRDW